MNQPNLGMKLRKSQLWNIHSWFCRFLHQI